MTFPSSVSESDRRAATLRRVARERAREGHVAAAFALFRRALELTEAREDPRAAADACWDAAASLDAAGDARGARYYAEQARTLYIALQDWRTVNRLYDLLGRLPVPAAA